MAQRTPLLDMDHFEALNRSLLESCSRVRELQDDLHETLADMEKNDADYHRGHLPKHSFRNNLRRFAKDRRRLEREINTEVNHSIQVVGQAKKLTRAQRV